MRLLLRLLSLAFLVLGVIAGTIDAVQSVAASRVTLTPLSDAWRDVSPATLEALTASLSALPIEMLSAAAGWLLGQPASIVLLVMSLLVYVIAYKRRKAQPRFYRA